MDMIRFLREAAQADTRRALPILSFPAAQKLGVTVNDLVHSAELQARAMALVAAETDTLAAVSLMDLSVEAEAFGATVRFDENEVPAVTGQLVADEDAANALAVSDLSVGRASICVDGVRLAKQRITAKPVLAGMIGPFSLAGRLMDVSEVMFLCYDEPETVTIVLEKATTYLIAYGKAMKDAGADGIVMAEPLAGVLSPSMAEEFSVPYVKRIVEALQEDTFAVIYHNCGNSVPHMLDLLFTQGAAAYHFGNASDMAQVMANAPTDVICMGNIDPSTQFVMGTPESITTATRELMTTCGQYRNFILSSGCDIPAHAPWENIRAFFDALN